MMEYTKPNGQTSSYEVIDFGNGIKVSVDKNEVHILAEKYRPRIVEDLILPLALKQKIETIIKTQKLPNMLFYSAKGGTGKDSIISVIRAQVPMTMMTINASLERGIDAIKSRVMDFVATPSFDGSRKVCYLTEAGGLTTVAMDSLKAVIEDFSNRVTFIMTTNSMNNISHALKSRFEFIDLNNIPKEERQTLALETFKRLACILRNEQVSFTQEDLGKLIYRFFPSYRELINGTTACISDGVLKVEDVMSSSIVNQVITCINNEDVEGIIKMSETINVHGFAQEINRLQYDGLLEDSKMYVAFIPALNELQQSIVQAVPFLNISFCMFCISMIQTKTKMKLQ